MVVYGRKKFFNIGSSECPKLKTLSLGFFKSNVRRPLNFITLGHRNPVNNKQQIVIISKSGTHVKYFLYLQLFGTLSI